MTTITTIRVMIMRMIILIMIIFLIMIFRIRARKGLRIIRNILVILVRIRIEQA